MGTLRAILSWGSKLFHSFIGALLQKCPTLKPHFWNDMFWHWPADIINLEGVHILMRSEIYLGAKPFKDLKTNNKILLSLIIRFYLIHKKQEVRERRPEWRWCGHVCGFLLQGEGMLFGLNISVLYWPG